MRSQARTRRVCVEMAAEDDDDGFFLILGHAFHLAKGRRAGTRIGLVGEEVLDDGGGGRRRNIIENPEVQ